MPTMKTFVYTTILLQAIGSLAPISAAFPDPSQTVITTSGRFAPYFQKKYPQVAEYRDIRYGQNPTGALRFAPPVPPIPEFGVVKATKYPNPCLQYSNPILETSVDATAENFFTVQKGNFSSVSEDCLHLSVFAPRGAVPSSSDLGNTDGEKLPVLVWIHGGGLKGGGVRVPYYHAAPWVERSQKHIIVQIQYRLNLLGFSNAAGLQQAGLPENVGYLDQRLAVEWVRQNIAAFGGDPSRITLWGQSAGAVSVDNFNYAYPDDPIMHAMILDSGAAVQYLQTDEPLVANFSYIAAQVGCKKDNSVLELYCMQHVPFDKLKAYIQSEAATEQAFGFLPVVDGKTVFANYSERVAQGFYAKLPAIEGTNSHEGNIFVNYAEGPGDTAQDVFAAQFGMSEQCTAIANTELRYGDGVTTHRYWYAGNFTNISPKPWLGAYHTAELPMFFGTYAHQYGHATPFQEKLSRHMQDLYLAFIQDPVNGLKPSQWPKATAHGNVIGWGIDNKIQQPKNISRLVKSCQAYFASRASSSSSSKESK